MKTELKDLSVDVTTIITISENAHIVLKHHLKIKEGNVSNAYEVIKNGYVEKSTPDLSVALFEFNKFVELC